MAKPIVALVGRPNVGKSTLFNRLTGERLAIVDDVPGTTRDRLYAETDWNGKPFYVVDTGGLDPTAGSSRSVLSVGSADFIEDIRAQVEVAIHDANVICFLVDVIAGVTPADVEVATLLRTSQRKVDGKRYPPILLVANKGDNLASMADAYQFYELGLGDPYPISALQGRGTGDLLDAIVEAFPEDLDETEDDSIKIAIVGKPNVGKSSLFNALLRDARAIVSAQPGTTRDRLEEYITIAGVPVRLIDTAGIRESGDEVERIGVEIARQALDSAHLALLVFDATQTPAPEEAQIAGELRDREIPVVLVINKTDCVTGVPENPWPETPFAAVCAVSATQGTGIKELETVIAEILLGGAGIDAAQPMITRQHQKDSLRRAEESLQRLFDAIGASPEFLALELRDALGALGEITGETTPEDILDAIFANFCIGK